MKDGRVQNTKKQKIGGLSLGWLLVTLCVLIYGVYAIGDKAMTISQLNGDMDQARLRLEEAQREEVFCPLKLEVLLMALLAALQILELLLICRRTRLAWCTFQR